MFSYMNAQLIIRRTAVSFILFVSSSPEQLYQIAIALFTDTVAILDKLRFVLRVRHNLFYLTLAFSLRTTTPWIFALSLLSTIQPIAKKK